MEQEKKEVKSELVEVNTEVKKTPVMVMRQIIIETDGTNINLKKAEVAGNIELVAILQALVERLRIKK